MAKVRTLKHHHNRHGNHFEKSPGDEYDLPEAEAAMLIKRKIVDRTTCTKPLLAEGGKA